VSYSVVFLVCVSLGLALECTLFAQDAKPKPAEVLATQPAPPPLTVPEVSQLQGALLAQRMANAELRIQAAQQEMQTIKADWDRLMTSLQKPGFTLNPGTWVYTKVEMTPPPKNEKK
jgi:hypothetical protein